MEIAECLTADRALSTGMSTNLTHVIMLLGSDVAEQVVRAGCFPTRFHQDDLDELFEDAPEMVSAPLIELMTHAGFDLYCAKCANVDSFMAALEEEDSEDEDEEVSQERLEALVAALQLVRVRHFGPPTLLAAPFEVMWCLGRSPM